MKVLIRNKEIKSNDLDEISIIMYYDKVLFLQLLKNDKYYNFTFNDDTYAINFIYSFFHDKNNIEYSWLNDEIILNYFTNLDLNTIIGILKNTNNFYKEEDYFEEDDNYNIRDMCSDTNIEEDDNDNDNDNSRSYVITKFTVNNNEIENFKHNYRTNKPDRYALKVFKEYIKQNNIKGDYKLSLNNIYNYEGKYKNNTCVFKTIKNVNL